MRKCYMLTEIVYALSLSLNIECSVDSTEMQYGITSDPRNVNTLPVYGISLWTNVSFIVEQMLSEKKIHAGGGNYIYQHMYALMLSRSCTGG